LVARLGAELDVPFIVDNDVNLAALGHGWKGAARGHADFVVLSLGTGIGGAIVADGRLLKGHRSGAGEIGFLVLSRELLRAARPGGLGSFETLASGVGMAAQARHMLDDTDRPSVLRHISGLPDPRDVIEAAAQGDFLASDIVAATVDHIAMAIIAIASICDPEIVVLDGSVGRALVQWAPEMRALAGHHLPNPPEVVVSTLGGEATAIGAVAAALDLSRTRLDPGGSQTFVGPDRGSSRGPLLHHVVAP
jgi:glucokinase